MAPTPITPQQQLRDAYSRVTEAIAAAAARSGRRAADIVAVAVTKTAGPDQIRQLLEMGHRDFGENRVQQLAQRVVQLQEYVARKRTFSGPDQPGAESPRLARLTPPAAGQTPAPGAGLPTPRWHMIGHLQRNKVKVVVPLVRLIHSVDSLRLAEELHVYGARTAAREGPRADRNTTGGDCVIDVLIQVNASGEESKFGVAPAAVLHLAEQIDSMIHLRLRGLMTIAPYSNNPEDARPVFNRTFDLFEEMRSAHLGGPHCNILSMGMTGDFEVAIEEGANLVRIGRGFFGEGSVPPGANYDGQTRSAADAESDDDPGDGGESQDPPEAPDAADSAGERDEGPRSAEARRKQRLAHERAVRARIARENRSARGGQR
jgi:pyridoxal phosphate enzyme (YggS family)